MLLIALGVFLGRRLWFIRPIEKHLGKVVLDNPQPLKQQKQSLDSQSSMQRELLERDMAEIRRDWAQMQQIFSFFRDIISSESK
jgi:hypothetical protein